MSNNRLVLTGLAELRQALRELPEALTGEASHIIEAEANQAELRIKSEYVDHRHTGNLADGLVSEVMTGVRRFSFGIRLKNTSPHAWLFENGTQVRHTSTGANRGAAEPIRVFIPNVIRRRREMYEQLKDLLRRNGLVVSGDA